MFIRIKTIKAKYIITGLFISILSLCVVSAASYYVSHSIVSKQLDMRMQAIADRNASDLNLWLNNYKLLVDHTVADIEIGQKYDPQTLKTIFAGKVRLSQKIIKDFYLGTGDNLFYSGVGWTPPPNYLVQTRPWFKEAVADGSRTVFTKPYDDRVRNFNSDQTTDLIVTISKAIYRSGKQIGVIAADISLKDVTKTVLDFSFGQKSYAFLLDSDGDIITHPHKEFLATIGGLNNIDTVSGADYSEIKKAVENSRDLAAKNLRVKDYDGVKRNVVLSKIASSGWILGIATDTVEYSKPLSMLLYGFAASMFVSLLIGIGIMLRLVKGMTLPISMLHATVKLFSANDMNARVNLKSDDEIGELATSFNKMADTIQEHSLFLEQKVAERTSELKEKNDNIMESIDYAERLQRAILPPLPHRLGISADKCFVIWKPKDVVGGDMYWCRGDERFVLVAVVDCTGHGVPGALMTMTVGSILDGLPRELEGVKPSDLLYKIHIRLKETLSQDHKNSLANDGADVALCLIDKMDRKVMFAGAKLSLFMEKNGEITEYKGTKHSVGYSQRKEVVYEDRLIEWVDGSVVYLTTDGLLDQHGEEGKWGIGRTGFVNLLKSIAGKPFPEQQVNVEQHITEQLKNVEQRDDITVVGFEIGEKLEGRIGI
jgi:serine phosphatase RsbU (regulator of sigma subunit)/HAMP domain-containing protein